VRRHGGQVRYRQRVTRVAQQPDGRYCVETNKGGDSIFPGQSILATALGGTRVAEAISQGMARRTSEWRINKSANRRIANQQINEPATTHHVSRSTT